MSTEKEDLLLRWFHRQGYTWGQAIEKVDEAKLREEGLLL